jgi:ATP-dependent Clp protease protease subunit
MWVVADEQKISEAPFFVWEAQAERLKAAAKKDIAEASFATAAARASRADASTKEIGLARENRKREKELVADEYSHTYRFLSDVNLGSVKACVDELTAWSRLAPGCDITLVLHSPGGDVVAGMALWDVLQELRTKGHHITTVARGYAASMAGIILQAGDVRVMGAEAWLLLHEGSFGATGSVGEVEDRVLWVKKLGERIIDLFMTRISQSDPATATKILKRSTLKLKMHRTDWWISSDEALRFGLIDEIR